MLQIKISLIFCHLGNFYMLDSTSDEVIFPSDIGLFINVEYLKTPNSTKVKPQCKKMLLVLCLCPVPVYVFLVLLGKSMYLPF